MATCSCKLSLTQQQPLFLILCYSASDLVKSRHLPNPLVGWLSSQSWPRKIGGQTCWTLQYGVGRPDGANTMIKTIQYLAEAEGCLRKCLEQTDLDFAAVFSRWYIGTTEHRMHYESSYTKINRGVDQGCPLSTCGFSAAIDLVLRFVLADICRLLHDPGAKLFACLDDWYLWIKPQYLLDTFAPTTAATRSVNLELQPSKIQVWRASCQDSIPHELHDKVKPTLSCLGGHLQIPGDIEPSLHVQGEQNRPPASYSSHPVQPYAKTPPRRSLSPPSNSTTRSSFLKASPHLPSIGLSSYPNLHHTQEPTSCNPAVNHTRLRTAVSGLLWPGD